MKIHTREIGVLKRVALVTASITAGGITSAEWRSSFAKAYADVNERYISECRKILGQVVGKILQQEAGWGRNER